MKGIVFTEFLEMVETRFGYEVVDSIIEEANLPSGGIYTAVGTYEHQEIVRLVQALSNHTKIGIPALLFEYGKHVFSIFASAYPQFFGHISEPLEFLESIEHHIHVEVRKLYPDAELPSFDSKRIQSNTLEMIYTSERKMADFAEGLIEGCFIHFNKKAKVEKEPLDEGGKVFRFLITEEV